MTSKAPTSEELKAAIKAQTGYVVDVLYDHSTILGGISLEPFGQVGAYVIFKQDDKVIAAPVPLSFMIQYAQAA